ncbi:MAG: hypothetical protein JHC33_12760 [Ignisphaera sp.]|nr:hypothetical protein [Ignisphaera sp.]
MEEQLITFETAKLAKEKGFRMFKDSFKSTLIDSRNYDVQRYSFYRVIKEEQMLNLNVGTNSSNINGLLESYDDKDFIVQKNYFAPTQSLLQKWLREVHNIDVFINRDGMFRKESYCIFIHDNIKDISRLRPLDNDVFSGYFTYEEALEVGLQEALKLI